MWESGILYSSISAFCRDHRINGDDFRRFRTFIHAVDAEYQAWVNETRKSNEEAH
jgi:hypothetical protein